MLCLLVLVISCAGSHGLSGQTIQASSTVAKEQSSKWAGVGPSPSLQRGHKILKVLVLTEKRYLLEMIVNRSETSLYDFG